jgi:hypothetical protein
MVGVLDPMHVRVIALSSGGASTQLDCIQFNLKAGDGNN